MEQPNIALLLLYAQNSAQLAKNYVTTKKMTQMAATTKIFAYISPWMVKIGLAPWIGVHLFVQGLKPYKTMESMNLVAHDPLPVYKKLTLIHQNV